MSETPPKKRVRKTEPRPRDVGGITPKAWRLLRLEANRRGLTAGALLTEMILRALGPAPGGPVGGGATEGETP